MGAFDGVWVAADWTDPPPRSYSGFFLPLIFSGLGSGDAVSAPAKHFGGRRVARAADVAAIQPFWSAVFSRWTEWVDAVRAASKDGRLDGALARGVSARASSLLPTQCPALRDAWTYGAVPHIKPQASLIASTLIACTV